jgi:hypothetical protein
VKIPSNRVVTSKLKIPRTGGICQHYFNYCTLAFWAATFELDGVARNRTVELIWSWLINFLSARFRFRVIKMWVSQFTDPQTCKSKIGDIFSTSWRWLFTNRVNLACTVLFLPKIRRAGRCVAPRYAAALRTEEWGAPRGLAAHRGFALACATCYVAVRYR